MKTLKGYRTRATEAEGWWTGAGENGAGVGQQLAASVMAQGRYRAAGKTIGAWRFRARGLVLGWRSRTCSTARTKASAG